MIVRFPIHEKCETLVNALLSFVVRATQEEATDREVQVLPQVAGVWLVYYSPFNKEAKENPRRSGGAKIVLWRELKSQYVSVLSVKYST